jgi:hypothetical protein
MDCAYQLVGDVTVIFASELLANSALHQPRERRQNVDRRVNLAVVELPVHEDLSFSDVTRQIRNRVRDILAQDTKSEN